MIFATLLLTVTPLAGCSNLVPLSGTVVFSDDGTPIPYGAVCFTDGKNVSRGTIEEDGTFVMGYVGMNDGIPPGNYTVYFFGVEPAVTADDTMDTVSRRKPLIDPKYGSAATSGLQVEVTGKTKKIEFKLDRYKPKK